MYDPDKSYDEFERNYQVIRGYITANVDKIVDKGTLTDAMSLAHVNTAIESIRNLYLEAENEILRRMLKEKENDKSCNCSRTV